MWLAHCQIDYTVASGDKQQAKRAKVRANWASQMLIPQKVTGIFDWWLWCISITKDTFYQHLVGMSHWLVGGRWVGFHFVMCPHPVPLYGLARRFVLSPHFASSPALISSLLLILPLYFFSLQLPASRPRSVCGRVKPGSMESGIGQIAWVKWVRRDEQSAMLTASTRGVWLLLTPLQHFLRLFSFRLSG